ncbi:MAG: serine/threonine-protein kinase [Gemmatimonadota bacterium]
MPDLLDGLAAALAPRYLVERELAAGGMGRVFLGHDPILGRAVAIKVLPPEHANAVAVERFLREARLLAKLAHPNIVPILDAQHRGDLLWFVMPLIRGDTLATRLLKGSMPWREVRRLGLDVLSALAHAHAQGVIHRDVKPSNIFLEDGRAVLADFGVALLDTGGDDTLTSTNEVVGTARYMAPEQRIGEEATPQSDIYSVGITLFEAATGRRWTPHSVKGAWRTVPRIIRGPIRRAVAYQPAERWPDATSFRRALRRPKLMSTPILALAAIGLIGLGGAAIIGASRATAVAASPASLAILPFAGDDSVGTQLARLTSTPIEWLPVRSLPFRHARVISFDSARKVSAMVTTGTVHRKSATVGELELQVYDSAGVLLQDFHVPGDPADLVSWGRAAADSLVSRLLPIQLSEFRQLAGTYPNRFALDAYTRGKELFQSGHWHEAEEKFATAERIDSGLVQASWQRMIARQWQGLPYTEGLVKLAARKTPMPQPFPRLLQAQLEPDLEKRLQLYEELVDDFPDDATVRQMAANELFGRGPLVGHPLTEGVDAFRRSALDIPDLDQATTYTQTIWGAARLGEESLAREQLSRRPSAKGDPWTGILWLAVNGRFRRWVAAPARELMLRFADSAKVITLHRAVRMGLGVDDPFDQDAIARFLERKATSDEQRASALAAQATALLLLGRPLAGLQALDRGAAVDPHDAGYRMQPAEWRVLLPVIPGASIALDERIRERGRLMLREVAPTDSLWPRAVWALTLDAIATRHDRTADSLLTLLQAHASERWVADLHAYALAIQLGSRGLTDSALALSNRIHSIPPSSETRLRSPLVRGLMYLYRGRWRQRDGDAAGAEREWLWHENNDLASKPRGEPEQGEIDAALSGVARLLRAENLPAIDRGAYGCRLLDRVEELWHESEPPMSALRDRVRTGRQACRR